MFSRLSQLTRHLARPSLNYASTSPVALPPLSISQARASNMTSSAVHNYTKTIHTAACLIIGDEVLGGKVSIDLNGIGHSALIISLSTTLLSPTLPFSLAAVAMCCTEVISEDRPAISEANYTPLTSVKSHDDITYESIAKAFGLKLKLHQGAFDRMKKLSKPHPMQPQFDWDTPSPGLTAKLRMVELPHDDTLSEEQQATFVADDMWVPIAIVNGNVHILPGVPRLFEKLLEHLKPTLLPRLTDPEGKGIYRYLFSTPLPESAVAPYLTDLATRTSSRGIKVGSYPRWGKKRNTVTLVGTDKDFMDSLVSEVEENVQGTRVSQEDELDPPSDAEEGK
ncbi:unnamed protein product [Aspergillus oryzae var. brunneus]|uniref:Unnamed protein product n=1 Tax=Aspergillus oryzae var. brunneus TaxID=332754 RepID=A0ABQ6KIG9_ASPOZ|nr:unnamed protein product [Aspergillus oryzae]GMG05947.1 unnamed protein product [Aspergillus oryzae]GMG44999.1 unnamed protein product [Aspergillus oryzae var. brunneus]